MCYKCTSYREVSCDLSLLCRASRLKPAEGLCCDGKVYGAEQGNDVNAKRSDSLLPGANRWLTVNMQWREALPAPPAAQHVGWWTEHPWRTHTVKNNSHYSLLLPNSTRIERRRVWETQRLFFLFVKTFVQRKNVSSVLIGSCWSSLLRLSSVLWLNPQGLGGPGWPRTFTEIPLYKRIKIVSYNVKLKAFSFFPPSLVITHLCSPAAGVVLQMGVSFSSE